MIRDICAAAGYPRRGEGRAGHSPGPAASMGFTLLELLVVLLIAVLMVTLVPPMFSGLAGGSALKGAARQLAAGLRSARNEAVTGQHEAVLGLDLERRTFSVTGKPREVALPPDITIELVTAQSESVSGASANIRFFPDGSSTGGRITLAAAGVAYLVDVDWLTGRVKILDRVAR